MPIPTPASRPPRPGEMLEGLRYLAHGPTDEPWGVAREESR
jgi:hypothetical protein